jgi:hypothetical protein
MRCRHRPLLTSLKHLVVCKRSRAKKTPKLDQKSAKNATRKIRNEAFVSSKVIFMEILPQLLALKYEYLLLHCHTLSCTNAQSRAGDVLEKYQLNFIARARHQGNAHLMLRLNPAL